jgi:polysaccharide biosynthesis transport protein
MSMSRNIEAPSPAGISPSDIYFVIFRHKWKIISLTLLGLAAATVFYFLRQPLYQSQAKIFIRYVQELRPLNPSESMSHVASMTDMSQNVMNSEMEILSSYDLAARVATNFGPDKILSKMGGGTNATRAAWAVQRQLKIEATKDSSVIYVTFRHADPDLVQPVLGEIINDYLIKHEQIHNSIGISDEVLQERITELRLQIAQTDDELRMAKTNAGIISIAESEKALQEESDRINRELRMSKASMFEHQTSMREIATAGAKAGVTNILAVVPADKLARYKAVCKRLTYLENKQNDYIQQGFTDQNSLIKENRDQMVAAVKTKVEMETQYPLLVEMDSTEVGVGAGAGVAGAGASESIAASLPLRIKVLEEQWAEIQGEFARLNDTEAKVADLERQKKVQEDNYNFYTTLQAQSHIDQSLGPNRVSNIREIQNPSPPYKDFRQFYKTIGMMFFGAMFLGLAWAFLIEFYLDRSVKRPVDLHTKLRIPFFLSIPDMEQNGHRRLAAPERKQLEFSGSKNGNGDDKSLVTAGALEIATPINRALQSHYDALRDRLVNYFESINLTRKPKLVAVTSTSRGAGVSTISAGLAASLSETGDGRVLLVDMNRENGAAQQFVRGEECKLDDALLSDKRDQALVQENLYVVSEGSNVDNLPRVLPKRFASLVPKLKASDYDYIIFDMPPVSQTSITTRLAGFMDTVMLVVESEKTDRDVVAQANELLAQSKANVTAVLNKTRKYIPARLSHDINSDM